MYKRQVFATFLAYAPLGQFDDDELKALIVQLREHILSEKAGDNISISQVRRLLIIRYLGQQAEQCKAIFIQLWQILRPLYLNKAANIPRIWHT